jgi:hypothetical protein
MPPPPPFFVKRLRKIDENNDSRVPKVVKSPYSIENIGDMRA